MTSVSYDIRVRTVVGPAIRNYLARCDTCTAITCGSVFRVQMHEDRDLISLYERLMEKNVDVISIRRTG